MPGGRRSVPIGGRRKTRAPRRLSLVQENVANIADIPSDPTDNPQEKEKNEELERKIASEISRAENEMNLHRCALPAAFPCDPLLSSPSRYQLERPSLPCFVTLCGKRRD